MSFEYQPILLSALGGGGAGGASLPAGLPITTVGSGGVFPSIQGALDSQYNILYIISDLTVNDTIDVPSSGLDIFITNGSNVDLGSGYFNLAANELNINGNGIITYDYDSDFPYSVFDSPGGSGSLVIEGIRIDNNSSFPVCLTNVNYARFSDVIFDGNVRICGDSNKYGGCIYRNSTIFVGSEVSNTHLDSSIFEGVVISDSGINSVFSDAVVY